ncbi:peptide/nickel transport system permease protein [Pseudaminobacter salicylatoxidans]|uniref:Peptide/nickel transport system permease protein n=1 Tax=Pseudaminobacter salicylatoxidans TaxID=93369 RepID=A0A316C4I6_PSESE|nr:ABC transporter permease [Pseudaminobacter salicylatoxidans]PWJ84601.1 peptide/nickel transport system permease protein [Pseudaminobacter salicylatoxidans]
MKDFLQTFKSAPPTAWFGMVVIAVIALTAVFAPLIAPYGETQIVGGQYEPWSDAFLLGTDNLGRDMFSRLVYGTRNTVGLALLATAIAFGAGSVLGIVAAVMGGFVDRFLSRIIDVIMAIPSLILALMLLTIVGASVASMIFVIALIYVAPVFRLARASAQSVVAMDYIEAARLRGEGLGWLVVKEVLPNIASTLVAEFGLRFCFVFLFIAALSFLGLGIQPPTADWGSMLKENATLISFGDITPLLPAAAIALLTVSVNFVVDWMLHRSSGLKD